ncbi:MAG: hypothetical protein K2X01_00805 [Cyanobacteria bacterium]|nr:hypothetical protein [Cyanobacteriota bacterium]
MLPVVSEANRKALEALLEEDPDAWKKQMIHYIKEENPEVNTILVDLAQRSQDPKAVIMAGFFVYQALDLAAREEDASLDAVSIE